MTDVRLGWIGLGSMGLNMALNLQAHLQKTGSKALVYTNRTLSRGFDLEAAGATPKQTVAEVVQNADIIFSCVSVGRLMSTTVVLTTN